MLIFYRYFKVFTLFALIILQIGIPQIFAESLGKVPINIQAALFVKLFIFHKGLIDKRDVSVYVMGDSAFAAEMKKGIGKKIGNANLASITEGTDIPSEKPSIIYVGDPSKLDDIIRYTRKNKVLSITGHPELVEKGVSLGVGVAEGKPKVLLNLQASKEENIDWNPAILKVSTVFK